VCCVHPIKAYGFSRGIALVPATPRPLYPRGRDPVPFVQGAGRAPGPVWTGAEKLAPTGIRFPECSARSEHYNGYCTWRPVYIYGSISLKVFLKREMFETKVVEKIQTCILCSITIFSEDRAVGKIMWKNMVKPDRSQMTI
jgi:hypothetical protein